MDNLKQIMYGVTDFARMRRENADFVDRTALIRELEKTSYALFLRPLRGTLFCAPPVMSVAARARFKSCNRVFR